jgi:hypothetical protein
LVTRRRRVAREDRGGGKNGTSSDGATRARCAWSVWRRTGATLLAEWCWRRVEVLELQRTFHTPTQKPDAKAS